MWLPKSNTASLYESYETILQDNMCTFVHFPMIHPFKRSPSGNLYTSLLLKITIEIVDFPMKHRDFPVHYVSHYQRVIKDVRP